VVHVICSDAVGQPRFEGPRCLLPQGEERDSKVVTPCSVVVRYERLRGLCCLYPHPEQGSKIILNGVGAKKATTWIIAVKTSNLASTQMMLVIHFIKHSLPDSPDCNKLYKIRSTISVHPHHIEW